MRFTAAAAELRKAELTRLADCVPPSLSSLRTLTPAPFRTAVALMLERLGYEIINHPAAHDLIVTQRDKELNIQKCIVTCAEPAVIEPTGTPALGRLHEAIVAHGAHSGFYVTCRAFTQQAKDYAKSAPIKLVDGTALERSMKASLADVQLPIRYDAMCCQCGSIVQHRLDRAEALPCQNGHAVPPSIALAAVQPKDYPPPPKRRASHEAKLVRALAAAMGRKRMQRRMRPGR